MTWGVVRNRFREVEIQMFGSLKLGKFFGIDTYIHSTFWLLPLFVVFSNLGAELDTLLFELAFVFAVFFCIALHEVGHALAARAYGIGTRHITLYPIGGVAMLERMPDKPWHEVVVALAGPAVNVVLAIGLFGGLMVNGLVMPWATEEMDVVPQFLGQLAFANAFLCLFNLLPAFPMDGGRVLRAVLASRMNRLRATEIAAKVGAVVAGILLIAGLVLGKFPLIFLAIVVFLLGQAELAGVRVMEAARRRGFFGSSPPEPEPDPEPTPLPVDPDADLAARRFSGLAWDKKRRVWVQWANGIPVRDLPT
jgi:Zn-dependent protease